MTKRRSWVEDYCEDGNMPVDDEHARGLMKLHASCAPPCRGSWWPSATSVSAAREKRPRPRGATGDFTRARHGLYH